VFARYPIYRLWAGEQSSPLQGKNKNLITTIKAVMRFFIDKLYRIGYNSIKERDHMSTRERILYKLDKFPESTLDELDRIITVYYDSISGSDDFDEQSFLQAIEDCENDNLYGPYDTVEEAMKAMLDE
jgi:hypothetical protein